MLLKIALALILAGLLAYSLLPTAYYKLERRLKNKKTRNKILYLTFDDGPDEKYTGRLLELLREHDIRASFFVVAKFAEEQPILIERMKYEGHVIGLHSLEHGNALWHTPVYTKMDFEESMDIMERLNVKVEFFRPPWGHFNLSTIKCMNRLGLKKTLWDVMAQDWKADMTKEEIARRLILRAKKGNIICLHDGRGKNGAPERTLEALREALPLWIAQGYKFETVDEL